MHYRAEALKYPFPRVIIDKDEKNREINSREYAIRIHFRAIRTVTIKFVVLIP